MPSLVTVAFVCVFKFKSGVVRLLGISARLGNLCVLRAACTALRVKRDRWLCHPIPTIYLFNYAQDCRILAKITITTGASR